MVTCAPLFIDKARLFPNCTFIVGADTVTRLLDKKYYSGCSSELVASITEIANLGCKFVVGGRQVGGQFLTLPGILEASELPASLHGMFIGLSPEQFRVDLSSSEIRAALAASAAETR